MLMLGVSPRGSLAIIAMAKANAVLQGRQYVIPEDVADVFICTVAHRLLLTAAARARKIQTESIAEEALRNVTAPVLSRMEG